MVEAKTFRTASVPTPCGKRQFCSACRHNWAAGYVNALGGCLPGAGSVYVGTIQDDNLPNVRKQIRYGDGQYAAVRRMDGTWLVIGTTSFFADAELTIVDCTCYEAATALLEKVYKALIETMPDGRCRFTHSRDWCKKPAKPKTYTILRKGEEADASPVPSPKAMKAAADVMKLVFRSRCEVHEVRGCESMQQVFVFWSTAQHIQNGKSSEEAVFRAQHPFFPGSAEEWDLHDDDKDDTSWEDPWPPPNDG
jgi:hypothetical protein